MADPRLGPNYGRAKLSDAGTDDAIHVLAPGERETTLCGQSLDRIVNACSLDSGFKPDSGSGCWACLEESNRWAAPVPRHFIATTTIQRFMGFCDENDVDPHTARFVRYARDLQGQSGGKVTILPDFEEGWQELHAYAMAHNMEVVVL